MNDRTAEPASIRVWDPVVRLGHWILVLAFAIAWFSDDFLEVHEWSGYVVAGYLAIRLIWGFTGTRHARFADFIYGPRMAVSYFLALLKGGARRYVGHSPAGAAMVFALLVMLGGTVLTGVAELARGHGEGPFASVIAYEPSATPLSKNGEESALQEIHELFANLSLLLIVLHIAGVVTASVVHRENLVKSMITGRKRP